MLNLFVTLLYSSMLEILVTKLMLGDAFDIWRSVISLIVVKSVWISYAPDVWGDSFIGETSIDESFTTESFNSDESSISEYVFIGDTTLGCLAASLFPLVFRMLLV